MDEKLNALIKALPKAELHLHIEGSLEPEMLFALAQKNGVNLPYQSVEEIRAAYQFDDLQSFLNLYYQGAAVLQTVDDFYALTKAYVERARLDNVRHAEIFFDPQTHTARGISLETVFAGLAKALREARETHGFSSNLILCFLRHLSEEEALQTFHEALKIREKYADLWIGVGLDSSEKGNPPEKFARVFALAKEEGFRLVAHAGEEGPPLYIQNALNILHVERIDHGVRAIENEILLNELKNRQIPLTVCPLSNLKLCVIKELKEHCLARLLRAGLLVTINSDDPAYFGGYINQNFIETAQALDLTENEIIQLAKNSFIAAFLTTEQKNNYLTEITDQIQTLKSR